MSSRRLASPDLIDKRGNPPRFAITMKMTVCLIRTAKGQRWTHDQRSVRARPALWGDAAARRADPAAAGGNTGGRPCRHAWGPSGERGPFHPRGRVVVGVDRRFPDPDPAAGV